MGLLRAGLGGVPGLQNQSIAQTVNGSLRFSSGKNLEKTFSSGNRRTFTFSCWFKPNLSDSARRYLFTATDGSAHSVLNFRNSSDLEIYHYNGSSLNYQVISSAVFRDPNSFYNVVVAYR